MSQSSVTNGYPSYLPSVSGRELDQLCRFAASLGTTLDVETLVNDVVEPLMAMSGADKVIIAVSQSDARLLILQTTQWLLLGSAKGISAPAIASIGVEAVAFPSIASLPSQIGNKLEPEPGIVGIVPLWAQAHLRGVILLLKKEGSFSPHMLKMLTTAGRQLALAIENSKLLADLQDSYKKLMDAQEDLIRAERLAVLGQLSATMAHEIRNPLATIFSAISQLRKQDKYTDVSKTLLDIAEEEAVRLNKMVSELLKFARPRKPVFEESDILKTVRKSVESRMQCLSSSVNLTIDSNSESVQLLYDEELIYRALDILFDNGISCFEPIITSPQITVLVKKSGVGAMIEVADNGPGIPPENISKVMEPFFSTRPTGTGLGLPTVKRIAEDHRGTIEINSKLGTGTAVRLFIQTRNRDHF